MRQLLAAALTRLASWLGTKAVPPPPGGPREPISLDAYRRHRPPSAADLLAELKGTAWTCASLNAAVCASFPPRLYVATRRGEVAPRCLTRALPGPRERLLRDRPDLDARLKSAEQVQEVLDHPLLTLLEQVNPLMNAFDLWELTQLYLEVHGCAYWYLDVDDALGVPRAIWMLPAHLVVPRRESGSAALVDFYEYCGARTVRYAPEQVIHFRFPEV